MKYNSGRSKLAKCLRTGVYAGFLAASSFCAASEQPTVQDQGVGQNISQAPVQVASVLQVSGSATRFTISAQHADIKNALKLIFDQAHRQFAPDGSVAGNITLALTGQSFSAVLDAVCRQTFLRFMIDKNGIYQITRDDEAVRKLVARTRVVNALLGEQLARLGYDVPAQGMASQQGYGRGASSGYSGASQNSANGLSMNGAYAGSRGGGMGPGSAGQAAPAATLDSKAARRAGPPDAKATVDLRKQVRGGVDAGAKGTAAPAESATMGRTNAATENGNGQRGFGGGFGGSSAGGGGNEGFSGGGGGGFAGGGTGGGFGRAGAANDAPGIDSGIVNDPVKYRAFLKENGLVSVIIPRDKPRAVTDVLLELSQQSNVAILIDPSIPRGYRFRLTGSIAPCTLTEALSLLSIPAHLEVRYIGNSILVSAKPEFQVYFGESPTPRAYYGNTQNSNQNAFGRSGQQLTPGQSQSLPAAASKAATPPKVQQKNKKETKPSPNP